MRLLCTVLFLSVVLASPANAQTSSSSSSPAGWELGLGPQVVYRESTGTTHIGGGLTVARRFEKFAIAVEGSGIRREGHNDWHVVGGPRAIFGVSDGSSYFAQVLAGTLIRQNTSTWAVIPGLGLDARVGGTHALRLQIDAPIDRSLGRTSASVRGSVWFMF
jgi:hypothetical protein